MGDITVGTSNDNVGHSLQQAPRSPQLLQALLDAGSDDRRQALRKPQMLKLSTGGYEQRKASMYVSTNRRR